MRTLPIIKTDQLTLSDIPLPTTSLPEIWLFALTFDLHERQSAQPLPTLDDDPARLSLIDLRHLLYHQQRKWNHRHEPPDPATERRLREIVQWIRARVMERDGIGAAEAAALPRPLQSAALKPRVVPPPDAPLEALAAFAYTFNFYAEFDPVPDWPIAEERGYAGVRAAIPRVSLPELRYALYTEQRRRSRPGAQSGPESEQLMRELVAEMGRRVAGR